MVQVGVHPSEQERSAKPRRRWPVRLLLTLGAISYLAGFLHLRADFPNGSPWMDWSKMTDEGWYGAAAIQHFVWGRWYLPGSFNPAVAMPVWPAMLAAWFTATGVSMIAIRTLTMLLYGASLVLLFLVVRRWRSSAPAALAVLLTAANPFCFAFDRLSILEPVLVFWMMLGLWLAGRGSPRLIGRALLVGIVLAMIVLTKTTGVALVPAVVYLLWADLRRASPQRAIVAALLACATAAALYAAYFALVVRPHYLADYRLLFSINGYNAHLSILPRMLALGLWHGLWISPVLFPVMLAVLVLSLVWLRHLWRNPLFGAAVLAMASQIAFIGYHTNFQPRYYLPLAMPMAIVIVLGLSSLMERLHLPAWHRRALWALDLLGAAIAAGIVLMAIQTGSFILRPEYGFLTAAQSITAVVRADSTVKPLLLSDSGGDITLFTGLPGLCDAYSVEPHAALLAQYQPGWYAAWPSHTGEAMAHIARLSQLYHVVQVAQYQVFDDPTRNQLVLYKLVPR
jgi:4-amino-4-deoxy-L-arabinose transferase-like glycosyltransferase